MINPINALPTDLKIKEQKEIEQQKKDFFAKGGEIEVCAIRKHEEDKKDWLQRSRERFVQHTPRKGV